MLYSLMDRDCGEMTNQEINEAVARKLGRELSVPYLKGPTYLPNYCSDISAAWEILVEDPCGPLALYV
jgi:hypothetical protein